MWRVLFAGILLSMSVSAGRAEERELLYPQPLAASPFSRSAVPESLQALRAAVASKGTVKVMVGTRVPFAAEGNLPSAETSEQRAEIAAAASAIRGRFGAAIRRSPDSFRSYDSIPFVALEVTAEELEQLAIDPDVISITEDITAEPLLKESVPLVQGDTAHNAGFTGRARPSRSSIRAWTRATRSSADG